MRLRISKFVRISADADPDAELRYTSSILNTFATLILGQYIGLLLVVRKLRRNGFWEKEISFQVGEPKGLEETCSGTNIGREHNALDSHAFVPGSISLQNRLICSWGRSHSNALAGRWYEAWRVTLRKRGSGGEVTIRWLGCSGWRALA